MLYWIDLQFLILVGSTHKVHSIQKTDFSRRTQQQLQL